MPQSSDATRAALQTKRHHGIGDALHNAMTMATASQAYTIAVIAFTPSVGSSPCTYFTMFCAVCQCVKSDRKKFYKFDTLYGFFPCFYDRMAVESQEKREESNHVHKLISIVKKDVVLTAAAVLAILSCFVVPPDGKYLSYIDWNTLILLFCLMLIVGGLRAEGCL